MFAKLLKYEWRSNAATLWILSAAALGVSLLGGVLMNLTVNHGEQMPFFAASTLFGSLGLSFLALIGYVIAVEIILLVRFYKSRFTDEGYLTFTLPVSSHQIFLSAALNMLIWSAISAAVLAICFALLLGLSQFWKPMGGLAILLKQLRVELSNIEFGAWPLYLVKYLLSVISGIVTPLTCLTVGSVIAKKHKILASFGIYYGISMIVSFLSGIGSAVLTLTSPIFGAENALDIVYDRLLIVEIAVSLIITLAGYFVSTYLMKRELNLS